MKLFPIAIAVAFALSIVSAALGHEGGAMKVAARFSGPGQYLIEVTIDSEHIPSENNPLKAKGERGALVEEFAESFLSSSSVLFDGLPAPLSLESAAVLPAPNVTGSDRLLLRFSGEIPKGARSFAWDHDLVLSEYFLQCSNEGDAEPAGQWLDKGRTSEPFDLTAPPEHLSTAEVARTYLELGFTHIIPYGIDHILFVLGLFLIGGGMKSLLMQVTAFTVAHTLTLGLTMCGIISLSASIVEPAIAISIVFVAVENIFSKKCGGWRTAVVFAFGLLHGMGFAGVLTELGLPQGQFVPALISFNVGVELGQLAVIGGAYGLVGIAFSAKPYYRSRVVIPASVTIALVGAYWAVERIAG